MLKHSLNNILLIFIIALFFSTSLLSAQSDNVQVNVLKADALKDFNAGQYSEALEKYETLLNRYPKDGTFNYYQGICYLNLKKDPGKAAEYLEFASTRANVPSDVFYYLGQAYMKTYRFTMARNSFEKFSQNATRQELRTMDPARQIINTQNAINFTKDYNSYEIKASSLFTFNDSMFTRQLGSVGGKLIKKPSEFRSQEKEGEPANYMFLPKNNDDGDYVYIAGYNRNKKGGTDLFRIKYSNGKKWGTPEPLKSLNTDYDEILPYFDPVGKDLYFASKGHSSMGGFDVFKSHYDEDRNEWSEPVNQGFPVNSPYDELLLIPGSNLGEIMLITDRQGDDKHLSVFKIQIQEPRKSLAGSTTIDMQRIGRLGEIKHVPGDIGILSEKSEKPSINKPQVKEKTKTSETSLSNLHVSYQHYLKQALAFQFKSDSLAKLARESRLKAKEISDPDVKWNLQKEIIEWEKNSKDFQSIADENYAKLKEMESAGKPAKTHPSTIKPDTVLSGITVYRFTDEPKKQVPEEHPEANNLPALTENKPIETPKETATRKNDPIIGEPGEVVKEPADVEDAFNRFVIMDKSPYSANNPIPVDLPVPSGAFYKIQIGVFGNNIAYDNFRGISPISGESIEGKNLTRYYAGKFNKYQDAVNALETLRRNGYNDSFIVAWFNGQKMPPAKVSELEKR